MVAARAGAASTTEEPRMDPEPTRPPALAGKVVLITGANSGIGHEAAVELARRGATVVVAARSELKAGAAVAAVRRRARCPDERAVSLLLDLARFRSIRAAAAEVLDRFDRLDVLVNNAGAILSDRRVTEDGFEMTFGVNHLGHFLLTSLLLDRLRAGAPARVVTVSSIGHRFAGGLSWSDLNHERGYNGTAVYNESKLANVLFTMELARRLDGTGVTANCLHPGAVRSGFGAREDTRGVERAVLAGARPFMVGPRRGAAPIVELAASPRYEAVTGQYFVGGYLSRCRRRPASAAGRDPDAARRLWAVSEELVAAGAADG
jgi:NAD(P)-dependent dehydrogenase (short-subunit alcohol dehydrogenase family)